MCEAMREHGTCGAARSFKHGLARQRVRRPGISKLVFSLLMSGHLTSVTHEDGAIFSRFVAKNERNPNV